MLTTQTLSEIGRAGGQVQETTDSRVTLEKFRRLGLYIILQHNGHEQINESMPYVDMLNYAKAHEKDLNLDGLVITPQEYGGYSVGKPAEISVEERKFDDKVKAKRKEWDGAGWDELKEVARVNGIDISRMQEEEVISTFVDAGVKRRPLEEKATETAVKDTEEVSPETMGWHELKAYAKEQGIDVVNKKKVDILKALAE